MTRAGGYPHAPRAAKEHRKPTKVGNPHPTRQSFGTTRRVRQTGSHLGSTLKPGRAVLTRGVFRRSGSVAYIRVDASPNEVHTRPIIHDGRAPVNLTGVLFPNLYASITSTHRFSQGSGARELDKCRVLLGLHPRAQPVEHLGRGDTRPRRVVGTEPPAHRLADAWPKHLPPTRPGPEPRRHAHAGRPFGSKYQ